jgi:hypothetical protein
MLKNPILMKAVKPAERLITLLREIPFLGASEIPEMSLSSELDGRPDFQLDITVRGQTFKLICEVKSHAQPRIVREAALQLQYHRNLIGGDAYGVFLAPFLSEASRKICIEHGIGYLDFEGNCRLVFDGVFIERSTAVKPKAERRELRSIFAPKSAQVLRTMMRDPSREWKVADLARAASVSLGHVSNVRTALLDHEWAQVNSDGIRIGNPDLLLDTWRDAYRRPGEKRNFYTPLHGPALQNALRRFPLENSLSGNLMLGSFSAAQWLAPYARVPTEFFYADREGLRTLEHALQLSSAAKGENVVVMELDDDGFFLGSLEYSFGIRCTDVVQTYLDLWISGDRGREAAEHLRMEKLRWTP